MGAVAHAFILARKRRGGGIDQRRPAAVLAQPCVGRVTPWRAHGTPREDKRRYGSSEYDRRDSRFAAIHSSLLSQRRVEVNRPDNHPQTGIGGANRIASSEERRATAPAAIDELVQGEPDLAAGVVAFDAWIFNGKGDY